MKLKRLLAPSYWKTPKKGVTWTVAPRPGPHEKFECIPLQIIARDVLKLVETGKEAKTIINKGEILVDGKIRKDHAFPVGMMDVVSIPKIKKNYRILPSKKGLELKEISEEEIGKKICRIENKTSVKKGKLQLNLHDGRNLLVDKDSYKTGDSVLIEVPSQKILEHLKMDEGSLCMVTKGKNSGNLVTVKKVITTKGTGKKRVICKLGNEEVEVRKDYVFVVGKEKPVIKVSE